MNLKNLGSRQREVIQQLNEAGYYSEAFGEGYRWLTHAQTLKVLDGLASRGLVVKHDTSSHGVEYRPLVSMDKLGALKNTTAKALLLAVMERSIEVWGYTAQFEDFDEFVISLRSAAEREEFKGSISDLETAIRKYKTHIGEDWP